MLTKDEDGLPEEAESIVMLLFCPQWRINPEEVATG